ncbi:MAG TPA: mechanosensitive ion channel family protein [Acidimicrobiia bacterium]|nr:mechanosensitive ion channel family protein [Acidimicrobiia bacterium]
MPIIFPDLPASLLFAQERTIGEDLVGTAIVVGVGIVVYWIALVLGRRYVNRMTMKGGERGARAATLWTVLRRVVLVAVLFTVVLFVFILWDWSITPFLGVGTVIAAAVGFGAQDLVKDFLAGFFILMEDQFHVGDTVTIAGVTGTVEDIQLRVTLLRDLEGNQHFVPNGQITVTSNFTSRFAQPVIDIGVAYETDIDRALDIFKDELETLATDPGFERLVIGAPEILGVNELGESAVILRGRLTTIADERWVVRREALRRIKKRFDAEGISIPFPQITLNKKGES